MTFLVVILTFIGYLYYLSIYLKRNKEVKAHLDIQEKYISQTITIEEKSITITQDSNETIITWASVKEVDINESYLIDYRQQRSNNP